MTGPARSTMTPEDQQRVAHPPVWRLPVPGFLVLSLLGAALLASLSLHQAAQSVRDNADRAHLERAMSVFEALVEGRVTAMKNELWRLAESSHLERALVRGSAQELEQLVASRIGGESVLDGLRVMSSGLPVVTSSRLRGGTFPDNACQRARTDGAVILSTPRSGVLVVATRDHVTEAGLPARICGAVDLAAVGFLTRVIGMTSARAFVRTHSALAKPVTADAASDTAELIRPVRVAHGEITLGVALIPDSSATLAWLTRYGAPAMPFVVVLAALITLRIWQAARGERERVQGLCESVADGIVIVDESERITSINAAASQILGVAPDEALARWLPEVMDVRADAEGKTLMPDLMQTFRSGALVRSFEGELVRPDGVTREVTMSVRWLGTNGSGLVVLSDVGDERKWRRQLGEGAMRDPLSGALTEAAFRDRLEQALGVAASEGHVFSVLKLELDGVDGTNHGWSKSTQDRLLLELVGVLYSGLRSSDLLARLASNRFGVLLPGCGREDALSVADTIRRKVRQFWFVENGQMFEVGVSIGAVQAGAGFDDVDAVLDAVNVACDLARVEGRNRVRAYQYPGRRPGQRESELACVEGIREALENGRFELFGQPLLPLDAHAERSQIEVLLRMRAEDGSHVSPAAFLPVAERHRLAEQLDAHVLGLLFDRHGCFFASAPVTDGSGRALDVTINLSGASLESPSFIAELEARIKEAGLSPGQLGFEITETSAVADIQGTRAFIDRMKQLGCPVILDDFGSGASSLARLRSLPVEYVKLDGSFARDVVRDAVDRAMVKAVCEVAFSLGIKVIAEHIQTREALEVMQRLGVDLVQGFAIAPPRALNAWVTGTSPGDAGPGAPSQSDSMLAPVLELTGSARAR